MQRHIHETSVSHSCFSTQKTTKLLSNVIEKLGSGTVGVCFALFYLLQVTWSFP